jgi:hypothetical protein
MENLFSLLNLAIPYASINETAKSDIIVNLGLAYLLLMVSEYLKSLIKHAHLSIGLDENSDLDRDIMGALILIGEIQSLILTLDLHILKYLGQIS